LDCDVIDLNAAKVGGFRYDQRYADGDEFLAIVEKMVAAPVVIFATPVYWYSFSTVMKNFIDRLSDLLMSRKDVGRRLRGDSSHKGRWALVSTGSDGGPDRDLSSAFSRMCGYLGVEFVGEVYGVEGGAFVDDEAARMVRAQMG
jgi:multimeric flavodoxin WrbA